MTLLDELRELCEQHTDDVALQKALAPFLRKKAVEHLESGKGTVAEGFRRERYAVTCTEINEGFIKRQKRNGQWGTYLEARALGEMLGFHIVITEPHFFSKDETWCLHRTDDDAAPIIHLKNSGNRHFYVNTKTKGDGNCLYNAFAQALKTYFQKETFSLREKEETAAFSQKEIEDAILKQPSPADIRAQLQRQQQEEAARLAKLPPEERVLVEEQIRKDHALALQLAREEEPPKKPRPL